LKTKRELKEKRKRIQEENVQKKAEKKEEAKLRSKGVKIDETKNQVQKDDKDKEGDEEI